MTGRRRLPRPVRRRFLVLEVRIWVAGVERKTTVGYWATRTTGRPKSHSRARPGRDAEAET